MAPDAIDAIDALKDLDRRGWDSYDGEPVSRGALGYARLFVQLVRVVAGAQADPLIGPRSDGGVSLLWRGRGSRKIEVRIPALPGQQPTTFIVSNDFVLEDEGRVDDPELFVKNVVQPHLR